MVANFWATLYGNMFGKKSSQDIGVSIDPPQKKSGKIFFRQLLCNIRTFSDKNHVGPIFRELYFLDKYHKNSGILTIFLARIT